MATATTIAAMARHHTSPPARSPTAHAVPTSTGTTAAGSVRGRAPATHVFTDGSREHPLLEALDAGSQEHDGEPDDREVDRHRVHVRDAVRERHAQALVEVHERVHQHRDLQPLDRLEA